MAKTLPVELLSLLTTVAILVILGYPTTIEILATWIIPLLAVAAVAAVLHNGSEQNWLRATLWSCIALQLIFLMNALKDILH